MRAIDTNVLARFLLNDDDRQSGIAHEVLAADAMIPLTVLLETAWLLQSRYRVPPATIAEVLLSVTHMPTVHIVDEVIVRWALGRAMKGGDLSDLLHIASAQNASAFVTFDRAIARAAGPDSPVPVETIGA